MNDIRLSTALIIKKDGEFLVGRILHGKELRWSGSPYDAWHTRVRAKARSVAEKVTGEIMLFNPISGQLREAKL